MINTSWLDQATRRPPSTRSSTKTNALPLCSSTSDQITFTSLSTVVRGLQQTETDYTCGELTWWEWMELLAWGYSCWKDFVFVFFFVFFFFFQFIFGFHFFVTLNFFLFFLENIWVLPDEAALHFWGHRSSDVFVKSVHIGLNKDILYIL